MDRLGREAERTSGARVVFCTVIWARVEVKALRGHHERRVGTHGNDLVDTPWFFLFPLSFSFCVFFLVCHFLFFPVDISAATMFNHQRLAWRRCLLLHLFYASVCSVTLRSGHARSTRKTWKTYTDAAKHRSGDVDRLGIGSGANI